MTALPPLTRAAAAPADPRLQRAEQLRQTARELEGVFVEQLFKAMRETVPEDGMVSGGSGEEMFAALLDQRLAAQVPGQWSHGLADALYRQLQRAVGGADAAPAAPQPAAPAAADAAALPSVPPTTLPR